MSRATATQERPRQFCDLSNGGTLLDHTLQRVTCVVPQERTSVVVNHRDQPFFGRLDREAGRVIIQPENRGTAPAVLYGLLSIRRENPNALVAIFPADHRFRNEIAFMMRVRSAFRLIERRPDLIIVLGIVPDGPATDCGWIEPGDPVPGTAETTVMRIHRFWDHPPLPQAESLLARGCLCNSLVVAGSADALLLLVQDGAPLLYRAFEPLRPMLGTVEEADAAQRIYSDLLTIDFHTEVLARSPQVLAVLPVADSGWLEAGDPKHGLSLVGGE
ncbi:MAG TPA: sugar phosphate nucleotidyltransferase [Candidatus Acidoferrum sp.]|nr:sugar phosphate nucleotidyltransferase [Candidatus Acidoferrum sp.]